MERIVLLGGGGHAQSVADTLERMGTYRIIGYTDIKKNTDSLQYLGTDETLPRIYREGVRKAAVCAGYLGHGRLRDRLYGLAKEIGFQFPCMIDPSAAVSRHAQVGEGTFIGKGAAVNACAVIGKMCIINTNATVEHHNVIGDFSHIAVGAALCGNVSVGSHSLVGANAAVLQGVTIGMDTIIGAGSIVLGSPKEGKTHVGIVRGE